MSAQTDRSGEPAARVKERARVSADSAHTHKPLGMGVTLAKIEAALAQRTGMSGLEEKAARPRA